MAAEQTNCASDTRDEDGADDDEDVGDGRRAIDAEYIPNNVAFGAVIWLQEGRPGEGAKEVGLIGVAAVAVLSRVVDVAHVDRGVSDDYATDLDRTNLQSVNVANVHIEQAPPGRRPAVLPKASP